MGPSRARSRWRRAALLLAVLLVLVLTAVTARLFVWPEQGTPPHVDAIIKLGGPADRHRELAALALAQSEVAPVLVLSTAAVDGGACSLRIPGVAVTCFSPNPSTTQGEAEFVGRMASLNHWQSITLVTTPDQAWRARLRMHRCFNGAVYSSTTPLPSWRWVLQIPYQWGATIKAVVFNTEC